MDFMLHELETMADSAAALPNDISTADVKRWEHLFEFTNDQAYEAIEAFRADMNRYQTSKSAWELIAPEQSSLGHNKESYEFSIQQRKEASKRTVSTFAADAEYLLKLAQPLDTPNKVQELIGSVTLPQVYKGEDCSFVVLHGYERQALEQKSQSLAQLTFLPFNVARKALSTTSIYPSLGFDTTMPQFRPSDSLEPCRGLVQQTQYPVDYFFYGTLAEPDRLQSLLGLPSLPILTPATVCRGKLETWARKYRALVDGDECDVVKGWHFVVENEDQELSLRIYETARYEVVRCQITLDGKAATEGLTFRFVKMVS